MDAKVEKRRKRRRSTLNSSYPVVRFIVLGEPVSSLEVQAAVTDISDLGAGLFTEKSYLEPGQIIKFTNKDNKDELPDSGVVMWTAEFQDGYRAGIMFA